MSALAVDALLDGLRAEDHAWLYRFLLAHGTTFEVAPLPTDVNVMQPKCCYLNSFTLATAQPDRFTYYEGVGSTVDSPGWVMSHAWCVDVNGIAVDPTWWGISTPPAAYCGLPLPLDLVVDYAYEHSRGFLSERWHEEIVQQELPIVLGVGPV